MTQIKPNQESNLSKRIQVEKMFDNISPKYDFLNKSLSFGIDKIWRKKAVNELKGLSLIKILDVATGTADVAIELQRLNPTKVIGVDISQGMLDYGIEKIKSKNLSNKIELIQADSENLPFDDNIFDAITVSFGVRNFDNLEKGLKEMRRVLKPKGKLVILEFSNPTSFPIKQAYNFYSKHILPFWGKIISKDTEAYSYLPESVKYFPSGIEFVSIMKNCDYKNITHKPLTFGICSIYTGIK